jgi:hypothetical protein
MTVVNKTYVFAPAQVIKSAEANQNFDDLVNYTNAEVIVRDASKAFTAIPSGPGIDPTSPNQLARKQYVDNADALRAKLDGTTPFTGIPSGPNSNPTTDDQFTRKKYVDDSAVTPLTFRPRMANQGQIIKARDSVVTTDASGQATVNFVDGAFPTECTTVVVTSGDAGVPTQFISVFGRTASGFSVRCFTADVVNPFGIGWTVNRAVSQTVRVSYIAIGF